MTPTQLIAPIVLAAIVLAVTYQVSKWTDTL